MNSVGWEIIKDMFIREFISGQKVTTFRTEGLSNEAIARDVAAREYAGKKVQKFLTSLDRIKATKKVEKRDWR